MWIGAGECLHTYKSKHVLLCQCVYFRRRCVYWCHESKLIFNCDWQPQYLCVCVCPSIIIRVCANRIFVINSWIFTHKFIVSKSNINSLIQWLCENININYLTESMESTASTCTRTQLVARLCVWFVEIVWISLFDRSSWERKKRMRKA